MVNGTPARKALHKNVKKLIKRDRVWLHNAHELDNQKGVTVAHNYENSIDHVVAADRHGGPRMRAQATRAVRTLNGPRKERVAASLRRDVSAGKVHSRAMQKHMDAKTKDTAVSLVAGKKRVKRNKKLMDAAWYAQHSYLKAYKPKSK